MGHGYLAVVGYGFIVDKEIFILAIKFLMKDLHQSHQM